MPDDPRAVSNWERATTRYDHYVRYLDEKEDRFRLSLIDLLYIRNFKGGMSVIEEPFNQLSTKLGSYESAIRAMHKDAAYCQPLGQLDDGEYPDVKREIVEFVELSIKPDTGIKGFKASFCSALLHFFFPSLVPIVDRRVVNGALIYGAPIPVPRIDTSGQVENLLELYGPLIDYFRGCLRADSTLSVRSFDRRLFIHAIPKNPRNVVRANDGK